MSSALTTVREVLTRNIRQSGIFIAFVAIIILFAFLTGGTLLTPQNVNNIVVQNSYILILAIGMVIVIIGGHIDLSVGSVVAFTGAIAGVITVRMELHWILGVLAAYYANNGASLLVYFAGIVPHGIFELPALIISLALGFYLCEVVVTYVRKNTKGFVGAALKNIARVFLFWVVPLLMVAAATEAYITPLILHLFV